MDTDEAVLSYRPRSSKLVGGAILPELDVFVHLLVLLRLLDNNQLDKVMTTVWTPSNPATLGTSQSLFYKGPIGEFISVPLRPRSAAML